MLFDKIKETTAFIQSRIQSTPTIGIILGSGLGELANALIVENTIPYSEIPNFPQSTVEGHAGKLLFGKLNGKDVIMMAGRFHYYEGYDMQEVTFPVRVMKALGVQTLMVSNAAGGMNPAFKVGDIMLISDHINQFPEHPLRGKNDERLGTRFPDMSEPYCLNLFTKGLSIAAQLNIPVQQGVYIGLQGPTFETPAEYRWLHTIGGDAVGMSTVPEVIVAIHGGMKVFAASIITDMGGMEIPEKVSHEEVLAAANIAAPKLSAIFTELAGQI
ncbi:purine-nucleoside phosphorylase [Taibaiella lutea]|uniref:Purine nucleoside phosphorylase n=1 Tax=Taibaiella lutea TaxID=2608001 RepID=A0A5M6CI10_9BACT|nr:purine-nucleoside phosphorylase [Taibaiella lutea]KAA5534646.1 purine-nucleoside phosphorylase [Taibaiella lutea]